MAERIRIKDIAKMADVSVGTVDRVIHGRSGVSEVMNGRYEVMKPTILEIGRAHV